MLYVLPLNIKHSYVYSTIIKIQENIISMHNNTAHHRDVLIITVDNKRATPLVGDDDIIGSSAVMTDGWCRVDDASDRL